MKDILDVCCGSKMFYFDKNNPNVHFNDIRTEHHILCDGRTLEISPDTNFSFTSLGFEDESFSLVVFDPPHLDSLGNGSWMALKYGVLKDGWKEDFRKAFSECFRVLKPKGILIFKWNETDITTKEVISLTDVKPVFGHLSGKRSNTHWICFIKE